MRSILGGLLVAVFFAGLSTQALAQSKQDPMGGWWYVKLGRSNPAGCEGICFRKYPDVGRGPELDRLACREECKANPAKFGVKSTKPAKGN